jgi:hypothetical protein
VVVADDVPEGEESPPLVVGPVVALPLEVSVPSAESSLPQSGLAPKQPANGNTAQRPSLRIPSRLTDFRLPHLEAALLLRLWD